MFDRPHAPRPDHRRHHRDMGFGPRPPMWLRDVFDPFRAGRPSVRRGDVRPLILATLEQKPMHGYQVIQELEALSGGRWRPSAGSVYPTLQQLEDEGLVRSEEIDGRRTYSLTDEGRAAVAAAPDTRGRWDEAAGGRDATDVRGLAMQLVGAVMQVNRMGSPRARREASDILIDARRQMYRLLAEDGEPTTGDTAPDGRPGTDADAGADGPPKPASGESSR